LQLAFEPFGDLLQGVIKGGAGPCRLYHHGPEGEGRILVATEPEIGREARRRNDDHQKYGERAMLEGPFGEVGAAHGEDPSRRTFWPGCSACTPAVTTISPPSSPWERVTVPGSKRSICTLCSETVMLAGSTSHTAGCPLMRVSALAGSTMLGADSSSMRPLTV